MNRVIKFRAWNKEKKIMCYGNEDKSRDYRDGTKASVTELINHTLKSPYTGYEFMQFTGVQDQTQTDVYENDIFKFENSIGVVKFGEYKNPCDNIKGGHIGFYVDWQGDDLLRKDLAYWARKLSVCGNVFDNAELLKGGNA